MIINDKIVYGNQDIVIPSHMNYGKFILDKFFNFKDKIALVSTLIILYLKVDSWTIINYLCL